MGRAAGRRAPSFSLPDFKGNFYDSLDFRGKPLIIEFMQTNCPHCSVFAKTLERTLDALALQHRASERIRSGLRHTTLELYDVIENKRKRTIKFEADELSFLSFELAFHTKPLSPASGQYNPGSATRIRGLFLAGQAVTSPGILGAVLSGFLACGNILGHDRLRKELAACRQEGSS